MKSVSHAESEMYIVKAFAVCETADEESQKEF